MFIEPHFGQNNSERKAGSGWIEVICGSMFSGKTEELIRRLNRALLAKKNIEIFKPEIDKRYHHSNVVSHNENAIRSTPVSFANDILLLASECEIVGIDEAQFFDDQLVEVCVKLADSGKRVIVAGLDMDFSGKPFEPVPSLMAVAAFITKVHAICMRCGDVASYSYRLNKSQEKVLVGEQEEYEARCRRCFIQGMKGKD
ncbi:thymidine kinase [Fulvivirgaceae bacterium BMA10]|uniref:Thymidine kinase n=1 Tax=Splendidivirga corallicola TaxID=3051826 RepID=A0ABT8KRE7_9BACT|nr:thymidine kinase [Fulvivirgaceae bacterium BMA10]